MLRIHRHRAAVRSFAGDTAGCGALAQHYTGVHAIPVAAVVGSVGRCHELCSDFLPVGTRNGDQRYRRVRAAMREGLALPAIEVYQWGDRYYVIDGHHRVAAARATGQLSLDAIVVEVRPTAPPAMALAA